MTVLDQPAAPQSRTMLAAGFILIYAILIGFTDNFVETIARDGGLWQFHATRTLFAALILAVVARPLGLNLRPSNYGVVVARSLIHGLSMMIYFGCLAFLSVAEVAAGLFTAPIFVLLIARFGFGQQIGPLRIAAVVVGFAGVLMVLGVGPGTELTPSLILPILAGAMYAAGNVATREWCADETPETLLLGFFLALGLLGLVGMAALGVWQPDAPDGPEGFVLRGAVWPTGAFLFWTFVQAAGSLLGVGLMVKSYQIAEASKVSVFEYVILPMSALWTWLLWGRLLSGQAVIGILLIFAAGVIIAMRPRRP